MLNIKQGMQAGGANIDLKLMDDILYRLSKSKFRGSFYLNDKILVLEF